MVPQEVIMPDQGLDQGLQLMGQDKSKKQQLSECHGVGSIEIMASENISQTS